MPKIKNQLEEKVFGPPVFPLGGRLPTEITVLGANYRRQAAEENLFCRQRDFSGRSQRFVCCQSMHISLFFDGTNNNDNNDTKNNHPSNIAKLYHASIQDDEAKGSGYYWDDFSWCRYYRCYWSHRKTDLYAYCGNIQSADSSQQNHAADKIGFLQQLAYDS